MKKKNKANPFILVREKTCAEPNTSERASKSNSALSVTLAARAETTSRKAFVGSLGALYYYITVTVCQPLQPKQVILLAQELF